MSKKYTKKHKFSPEKLEWRGSLDSLLIPGNSPKSDSGFFVEMTEEEFMEELNQSEMDDLMELIEELENKNEKDN